MVWNFYKEHKDLCHLGMGRNALDHKTHNPRKFFEIFDLIKIKSFGYLME